MPNATLLIDPTRKGAVDPFYVLFPTEPTPSDHSADWLQVPTPHVTLRDRSLDALLEAIVDNVKQGGNVLFVGHGFDTGFGLFIGDVMHQHFADFPSFQSIRQNLEGKKSDADTAKDLELTVGDYQKLKLLVEKVQKLSLNRVDARACDMGKNDVLMSAVQVFFDRIYSVRQR